MVIFDIVLLILLAIIGGFYVRIEYKKYIREINELKTAKQRAINDLDKYTKQVDRMWLFKLEKIFCNVKSLNWIRRWMILYQKIIQI